MCKTPDCLVAHYAKGWCYNCYKRDYYHSDVVVRLKQKERVNPGSIHEDKPKHDPICSMPNCIRKHGSRGLCNTHYAAWRYHNISGIKEQQAQARKDRLEQDPNFRLSVRLRSRIGNAVKQGNKAGSAIKDLGCSISTFRLYIENQFEDGMTWDNYGDWHLDHVMPLAYYDLTDRGEFQTATHYLNYQPLWARDNLTKGARVYV